MSKPKSYFVRLKPYNKRRQHLCRGFMTGGVRFTDRWLEVSARKARELEGMVQPHDPEAEIPLFDVKTAQEAKAIEEKERDENGKPSSRVKDAERVPDSKFRNDKPEFNDEGEIVSNVEPAEIVEPPSDAAPPADDQDEDSEDAPKEAAPAPSLRAKRAKTRS